MTDVEISVLPTGLTVITDSMPDARSVAVGAWVGVGSRDEPRELAGVSHLLEHLIFKGTPTRSAQDIARSVDRCGGDFNAFTTKEYTAFHCRLPAGEWGMGVELLADVMSRPRLDADDVRSERHVVLEELAMDDDSPDDVAHRESMAALFRGHPLGRDTAGERETVAEMEPEAIRSFFRRWYTPATTTVAVAGPVVHDAVVEAVERGFMTDAESSQRPGREAPSAPVASTLAVPDDTEQVHLVWAWPGVARTDEDREALDVANHVLGGGLSSRLFDEIRERRGLAYAVYSGTIAYADSGVVSLYVGTMPEHVDEVRDVLEYEIERLVTGGVTPEELEIAVGYLTGSYELGLDDTGARMARAGGQWTTLGRVIPVEEQIHRWRNVTGDDVDRVLNRTLAGPRISVAVGPVDHRRGG